MIATDTLSQAIATWLLIYTRLALFFATDAIGSGARAFRFCRVLASTIFPHEATSGPNREVE
jgi:hypothetical protein